MGSRSRNWAYGDGDDDEDSNEESSKFAGTGSRILDKLGKTVEKSLHIADNSQEEDDSDEELSGNVFGNIRVDEFKSEGERKSKHVAFPSPGDLPPSDGSSDEEYEELGLHPNINHSLVFSESEDEGPSYVCEICLPDPSTLVPALRGSHKKQSSAPKERRVSWSPEVYDPIPKEVSYAVKSKQKKQPKSEKKTGKEKHKGNKASSTKDKKQDKKQVRKNAGSSGRGQKSSDADYW
uniref:Uncharacterized protein n=1 Tax=Kalanchoe fedtschenkoi TaxID=63787 RepID=A0A7N0UA30_KALFE